MVASGTVAEESAIRKSLKSVMIIQALLGINRWTDFVQYSVIKRFAIKLYSIIVIISLSIFYIFTYIGTASVLSLQWYSLFMGVQSAIVVFAGSFAFRKKFDKLIKGIQALDAALEVPMDSEVNKILGRQVFIIMTMWWGFYFQDVLTHRRHHGIDIMEIINYGAVRLSRNITDLDILFFSLMFHVVHIRMKIIRKFLETPEELTENKGILGKLRVLVERPLVLENTLARVTAGKSRSYEKLIKCYEKAAASSILLKECCSAGLLICMSIQLPRTLIVICEIIVSFLLKKNAVEGFSRNVMVPSLIKTTALTFIPCIIADWTNGEIKKMNSLLSKRLIRDQYDKREDEDIKTFLMLIEVRPATHTLYSLLRLDLSLPVDYLKLLCTYVIIILQLTHLKGFGEMHIP